MELSVQVAGPVCLPMGCHVNNEKRHQRRPLQHSMKRHSGVLTAAELRTATGGDDSDCSLIVPLSVSRLSRKCIRPLVGNQQ